MRATLLRATPTSITGMDRTTTTEGTLARLGFGDPHRAAVTLDEWFAAAGDSCGDLVDQGARLT